MTQEHREQEERLLEKFNRAKNRLLKNRLIWITILNVLTFFSFIFAMAYYKWAWAKFIFNENTFNQKQLQFWVNLLYIKQDVPGSQYERFSTLQARLCGQDISCSAVIYEFEFVGYISFSIFCLAGCLQLYDFITMIIYVWRSGEILESKDNFRHLVTIATYIIGLTLSVFSISVIKPKDSYYGVSFWFCVGTLCVFVAVIIYEQISIRKMIKQALILNLIEKEKKVRAEEMIHKNIEMSNEISVQGEGQLTL